MALDHLEKAKKDCFADFFAKEENLLCKHYRKLLSHRCEHLLKRFLTLLEHNLTIKRYKKLVMFLLEPYFDTYLNKSALCTLMSQVKNEQYEIYSRNVEIMQSDAFINFERVCKAYAFDDLKTFKEIYRQCMRSGSNWHCISDGFFGTHCLFLF